MYDVFEAFLESNKVNSVGPSTDALLLGMSPKEYIPIGDTWLGYLFRVMSRPIILKSSIYGYASQWGYRRMGRREERTREGQFRETVPA